MYTARTERVGLVAIHLMLFMSLAALAHSTFGHFYRYSVEDQLKTWHDGRQYYQYTEHPADAFDASLYEELRSVEDVANHIRSRGQYASEHELLLATFDVVRTRFLHFMYPHHTWITNPALAFLEFLFPEKAYNSMALADVKLRHAVGVPCGGSATTFVEVYRAVGGRAQFVSLGGPPSHQLAEAIADGRKYLIDTDLEAMIPMSIDDFAADPSLIPEYYGHRSVEKIEVIRQVFAWEPVFAGYDGLPSGSPRGYVMQAILEKAKFALPVIVALLCLLARSALTKSARQA